MHLRESSMPPQDYWESLFDTDAILARFDLRGDVAELGCGYGTFTLPLARHLRGTVHAIDIDPLMVETVQRRAAKAGLSNIKVQLRDVMTEGFGLPEASCDGVLLFNILHGESPLQMLGEARRILKPNGTLAVIHWRSDIDTPRGPSLAIRPSPEQIIAWTSQVGGFHLRQPSFPLPPWHFGLSFLAGP
jgi:ubiquinone/menaquinone biosynthesis C-methylase UbiE